MTASSLAVCELPLFPLDLVLFPGAHLPLHIFEYRYRIMMQTILAGDRRFGVVRFDPEEKTMASIGCCAQLLHHQPRPDDLMDILTVGQQRFRILEYVRQKPYWVGLVQWIEDRPVTSNIDDLAAEVSQLLQDVVRLSSKLTDREVELPDELPSIPTELSYWVGSKFYGATGEQQALLEMQDTTERLERESEILSITRNHLAARAAIEDTFKEKK